MYIGVPADTAPPTQLGRGRVLNDKFMKDRRKEMRPPTRLQLLQVAGRLSTINPAEVEVALSALYHDQPMRWQLFMDEALVLLEAIDEDKGSGFAETVVPED
jgi:hypothetical protein